MNFTQLGHAIRKGGSLTALLCVFASGFITLGSEDMLTQDRVRELFDYREDGILVWKQGARKGKEANCVDTRQGYRRVRVDGKLMKNARVVFLYHNGHLPDIVDHADRNRLNDTIQNLRSASYSENSWNGSKRKTNTSGCPGVCFSKQKNKWQAKINHHKKQYHLGFFVDFDQAVDARKKGERRFFGKYAPS